MKKILLTFFLSIISTFAQIIGDSKSIARREFGLYRGMNLEQLSDKYNGIFIEPGFRASKCLFKNLFSELPKPTGEAHLIDSINVFFESGDVINIKCSYNTDNKINSFIAYIDVKGKWQKFNKEEYYYNENGSLMNILSLSWNGTEWVKNTILNYNYNDFEKLSSVQFQYFNNNSWRNANRDLHYYDTFGNRIKSIYQDWVGHSWQNSEKDTMVYNSKNRIFHQETFHCINDAWIPSFSWNFEYDDINDQKRVFSFIWDGGAWSKYGQSIWERRNETLTINSLLWVNNEWTNYFRVLDYYDNEGYLLETVCNYYRDGTWVRGEYVIGFENPDGFNLHFIAEGMIVTYGNPPVVNVEHNESNNFATSEFKLEQNYPNPFNPTTSITYQIPSDGFVNLTVYNSLGEVIKVLVNEYQTKSGYTIEFDASNLPSGLYLYKLQSNEFSEVKKMILTK